MWIWRLGEQTAAAAIWARADKPSKRAPISVRRGNTALITFRIVKINKVVPYFSGEMPCNEITGVRRGIDCLVHSGPCWRRFGEDGVSADTIVFGQAAVLTGPPRRSAKA